MKNINQSTNNNKKYAIAYIRLQRTKLGIDDLHRSRSDQKERCEKAIKESEYTLLKTIEDTLVSGNTLNRKGIKEIIKLVKNNEISAIYVNSIDRLSRNVSNLEYLKNLFLKHGVTLINLEDTNSKKTATDICLDELISSFCEYKRREMSEKIKTALEGIVCSGFLPSSSVPFGYKSIYNANIETYPITKKVLVPDSKKAVLVKELFTKYATGKYNVREINDLMFKKGLRGKDRKKLPCAITYRLLRNPFYVGKIKWAGKIYAGKHTPLVDRDLFEKVQTIINSI